MVGTIFFGIAIIPIIITLICRAIWPHKITWLESGGTVLMVLLVCAMVYFIGSSKSTTDYQVRNGEVTGKERKEVPCEHSYSCNCVTRTHTSGSGKSRTTYTTTHCDTCYEHHGMFRTSRGTDFDWDVYTNMGIGFEINRIDSRGVQEPPRWTMVTPGQPVAISDSYENLVLAVPDSMFGFIEDMEASKFEALIPSYPSNIYDYQYCDRVLSVGVPVTNLKDWNTALSVALKTWGPKNQANVIILLVNTDDPKYIYALEKKWKRGKMNDVVIVLGAKSYPMVDFVRILSWSEAEEFKVALQFDLEEFLLQYGVLDMHKESMHNHVIELIDKNMKVYKRFDRTQMEYLRHEIQPPMWAICVTILIAIIGTLLCNWFTYKQDTGGERRSR